MKKLLRKLFNRTMLVVFILVIELAVIVGVIIVARNFSIEGHYLYENFPNLRWIGMVDDILILVLLVLQIIMLFQVLYRHWDAEFKIPWILILILLPIVGSLLYIIFGRRNLKKKHAMLLKASDGLSAKYFFLPNFIDIHLAGGLPGSVHGEHPHAAVDDLHAVKAHDVGDGAATP